MAIGYGDRLWRRGHRGACRGWRLLDRPVREHLVAQVLLHHVVLDQLYAWVVRLELGSVDLHNHDVHEEVSAHFKGVGERGPAEYHVLCRIRDGAGEAALRVGDESPDVGGELGRDRGVREVEDAPGHEVLAVRDTERR